MKEFKVSLIIPCFNASEFLQKMFNSVENQTIDIFNVEVIFVYDTHSIDNTLDILHSFKSKYNHFKIVEFNNPLHTAGLPRNAGLNVATGDYIVFLDCDDTLELDALDVLYNKICEFNVDILKSNYSLRVNDKIIRLSSSSDEPIFLKPHTSDLANISDDMVWATIYRRSFLKDNGIIFSSSLLGEDTEFIANCLVKTNRSIVILDYFYSVIYTSDNVFSHSHTVNVSKLFSNVDSHRNILNLLINNNENEDYINNTYKRFILNGMSNILRSYESYGNKKLMVCKLKDFILDFDFLNPDLEFIWKVFYVLFIYECNFFINVTSVFIRFIFDSKIFGSLQLRIRKRGWDSLKK